MRPVERCYLTLHPDQSLGRAQGHSAVRKQLSCTAFAREKHLKVSESQDNQRGTF